MDALRHRKMATSAIAFVTTLALAIPAFVLARGGGPSPEGVTAADDPAADSFFEIPDERRVAGYWTQERMRDAAPAPLGAAEPAVERGYAAPDLPFTRRLPRQWERMNLIPQVGELFYTHGGQDWRCSATVVGWNHVLTAGHCLHEGDGNDTGLHGNIMFAPAWDGSQACPGKGCPHGLWTSPFYGIVKIGWRDHHNYRYDLAGIGFRPGGKKNKSLGAVVGTLGTAARLPRLQHWNTFGYPCAAGNTGNGTGCQWLQQCQASFAYQHWWGYGGSGAAGPDMSAIGCDLGGGVSGGPWIWKYGTANLVGGVHSAATWDSSGNIYEAMSPFFKGIDAKGLISCLRKQKPVPAGAEPC